MTKAAEFEGRRIFLSYRSRDEHQVKGLSYLLKNLGNDIVKMGEFPSGVWSSHIYKSIAESDTLLVFVSLEQETHWAWLEDIKARAVALLSRIGWKKKESVDWMREEFEHFVLTHPDRQDIVVYKEEDAETPEHLADFQVHPFSSDLTEIRMQWRRMLKDGVPRRDAKEKILKALAEKGIQLDELSAAHFFDTFGTHNFASALRWAGTRTTRVCQQSARLASRAMLFLLPFATFAFGWLFHDGILPEPKLQTAEIRMNMSGREACAKADLVCVSVRQSRATKCRQIRRKMDFPTAIIHRHASPRSAASPRATPANPTR